METNPAKARLKNTRGPAHILPLAFGGVEDDNKSMPFVGIPEVLMVTCRLRRLPNEFGQTGHCCLMPSINGPQAMSRRAVWASPTPVRHRRRRKGQKAAPSCAAIAWCGPQRQAADRIANSGLQLACRCLAMKQRMPRRMSWATPLQMATDARQIDKWRRARARPPAPRRGSHRCNL